MIITGIIELVGRVFLQLLDWLPDYSVSFDVVQTSLYNIISYAFSMNSVLPIYEAVQLMQWTVGVLFALVVWHIVKVIWSIAPIGSPKYQRPFYVDLDGTIRNK